MGRWNGVTRLSLTRAPREDTRYSDFGVCAISSMIYEGICGIGFMIYEGIFAGEVYDL